MFQRSNFSEKTPFTLGTLLWFYSCQSRWFTARPVHLIETRDPITYCFQKNISGIRCAAKTKLECTTAVHFTGKTLTQTVPIYGIKCKMQKKKKRKRKQYACAYKFQIVHSRENMNNVTYMYVLCARYITPFWPWKRSEYIWIKCVKRQPCAEWKKKIASEKTRHYYNL